jgi:hypothetical protein
MTNKVILPLSPTDMVEFFKNKEQSYVIDYEKSVENLTNPKFLLMYVANLGLKCEIDKVDHELMAEYMILKEFTDITNLRENHANILYLAKFGEMLKIESEYSWKIDDCIDFAKTHHDILIPQMAFTNSIPLYIFSRLYAEEGELYGPLKEEIVQHEEPGQIDEIGYSLIKLFTLKEFLLAYLAKNIPLQEQVYFTRYFDEYMFSGSNLFSYVFSEKNIYANIIHLLTSESSDDKQRLDDVINDMKSILPN